ncbi:MAG: peptide chain release factor 1 [Phycisphaerales bacterium]|nr:peptide chain release factor 1 [Phycisphaerales bacterium]
MAQDPAWMPRIAAMAVRIEQITSEMNRPEVASNGALIVKLGQELGQLEKFGRPYREYRALTDQAAEMEAILADAASDADLRSLAEAELPEIQAKRTAFVELLQAKLVTGEESAVNSIILEIRAGTGGDEAALFAGDLVTMYSNYAARKGYKTEVMSVSESELGGIREAILNITGDEVYLNFAYEGGGHRVQRVPTTETQGRIHTSLATVAVLPEPDEVQVEIDWSKDVLEHVSAAGGPGGQNVNKVASAIKLEHIPTGITVSMRDERSQHKNRARARRVMMSRVFEHYQRAAHAKLSSERKSMIGSGDRSDRIRTYNFPQNRVTDHRIGKDIFDIPRVLSGDIDEFVRELRAWDVRMRLDAMAGEPVGA